jgi:hypothetical protein
MSGLAAVRGLTLAGHSVACYEAGSHIGGMWRYENDNGVSAAYASLHANTSSRRMEYPSLPMPGSVSEFPHHTEILAYLEDYAHANDLLRYVKVRHRVEHARPIDHGWDVTVGATTPKHFDALVVATGHYWDADIPHIAGHFDGPVTHVRDYRTPEQFSGQRVVVVGAGQSALDIAAELSAKATVTLSIRQSHHLIPNRVFGRPIDALDTAVALAIPLPVARFMYRLLIWAGRGRAHDPDLPPPRHRLLESRWPVVVSPQLEAALANRAFQVRPPISALGGDRVHFADESEAEADTILFATGYRINFPFLPEHSGHGVGWEFPLYRRVLSPHVENLGFIGVLEPGPGLFEIVERQATWLGEVLAERLDVPPRRQMWQAIGRGERRSRRQFGATGDHTILCNRHAYLRILDRDLRLALRERSPAPISEKAT